MGILRRAWMGAPISRWTSKAWIAHGKSCWVAYRVQSICHNVGWARHNNKRGLYSADALDHTCDDNDQAEEYFMSRHIYTLVSMRDRCMR